MAKRKKSIKDSYTVVREEMFAGKKLSTIFDKIVEDLKHNDSPSSKLSKDALEYLELRKSEVLQFEEEAPKLYSVIIKCGGLRSIRGLMANDEVEARAMGIKEWEENFPHVPLVKGNHRVRVEQVDNN